VVITGHRVTGGWVHILWDPAHAPALLPVMLASCAVLMVAAALVRIARRRLRITPGRRRGGLPAGGSVGAATRNTFGQPLDEWLAEQAAGEDE
jgi:hypothetical protein